MESTTIEISNLPESVVKALSKRAEEAGTTMPEYVRYLIEDDLSSSMSLRVLFAPVREQIRESGIPEDELDALLEEAREEAFQERQGKNQSE
ncbi:MAG: hypothetical protein L0229_03580 [Blastocatellia bacterium]|nr:hypothetical protein [Blastocatellia bacterium]